MCVHTRRNSYYFSQLLFYANVQNFALGLAKQLCNVALCRAGFVYHLLCHDNMHKLCSSAWGELSKDLGTMWFYSLCTPGIIFCHQPINTRSRMKELRIELSCFYGDLSYWRLATVRINVFRTLHSHQSHGLRKDQVPYHVILWSLA